MTRTVLGAVLPHPGAIRYGIIRISGDRSVVYLLDSGQEGAKGDVNPLRRRQPSLEWCRRGVQSLYDVAERKNRSLEPIVLQI